MTPMQPHIRSVLVGSIQPLGHTTSGIAKQPVGGPVNVGPLGITGDQQADRRVHGGEDKAVLCYAWAHYAAWRQKLSDLPLLAHPGAFGENLSIAGLDEHSVCIGDHWRMGTTLFAVTQGRQPCFKLNLRFGIADMAARVQTSLHTGWYLRVLESGQVATGDTCELIERPHPEYTVASLLALIRDRETRPDKLVDVLSLPLPPSWRKLFESRYRSGQIEDWQKRMLGE